eukprot:CAMPEP_0172919126 /NCGR_PEP_ID=MMETSP1075-20121228/201525_1 /TAXON_ID=2916 /ORGANISM="Ceratium fusus, Strain PA161109" /LENGTH=118 /DNA_ID=CAMNT_0013778903 /DNA_START=24 /DNA_END=377 /DNA_ORIENTATION=+
MNHSERLWCCTTFAGATAVCEHLCEQKGAQEVCLPRGIDAFRWLVSGWDHDTGIVDKHPQTGGTRRQKVMSFVAEILHGIWIQEIQQYHPCRWRRAAATAAGISVASSSEEAPLVTAT